MKLDNTVLLLVIFILFVSNSNFINAENASIPLSDVVTSQFSDINQHFQHIYRPVERINWHSSQFDSDNLLTNHHTPVIIEGTSIQQWPAFHKWSYQYLKETWHAKTFNISVKHTYNPVVIYSSTHKYYATKPNQTTPTTDDQSITLDHLKDLQLLKHQQSPHSNYTKLDVNITDFLNLIPRSGNKIAEVLKANPQYYYYTDQIVALNAEMREDLLPFKFRKFFNRTQIQELRKQAGKRKLDPLAFENQYPNCDFNIWAGSEGITAFPHMDVASNFFIQMIGDKKFELVSPEFHDQLLLYPKLHPNYRQAKYDWGIESNNEKIYSKPTSKPLEIYTAELTSGDVLFFPAGWFHRVTSLTYPLTFSLNAWCFSKADEAVDKVKRAPLPFEAEWNREHTRTYGLEYMKLVLNKASHITKKSATDWIKYSLQLRYNSEINVRDNHCELLKNLDQAFCGSNDIVIPDQLKEKFNRYADSLVRLFNNIAEAYTPNTSAGIGLAQVSISTWVEELASFLTEQEFSYSLLQCCFQ